MERVLSAPVSVPKEFDRKNENAFRQYAEGEFADFYRKSQNLVIPYGFNLGFNGTGGEQVVLSYDGTFKITINGSTVVGFTTSTSFATLQSEVVAARSGEASLLARITTVNTTAVNAGTAASTAQSEITAAREGETSLLAKINAIESAVVSGDAAVASTVTTLTATVNAKNQTFVQASAPTAIAAGDLWIDSDDNNKLYRATAAGSGSWSAVAYSDTGKVTTFAQTSAPTALAVGDLWIDTDDSNKVYRATATGSGSWSAVDDARISINATAIATVDGKLSASYGLTVDGGGRIASMKLLSNGTTSSVKFKADTFAIYNNITDVAVFDVTGSQIKMTADLNVSAGISVGSARLKVALESILKTGADGAAITWADGTSIGSAPAYVLDLSGLAPLAAGEVYSVSLTGVTATGATVYAKILTPGTTSTVTQTTDAAGGGGDPTRVMAKTDSADAYNGVYNFRVVGNMTITGTYESDLGQWINSGNLVVSTWFNDGGGWDQGPNIEFVSFYASATDDSGTVGVDDTFAVAWTNAIGAGGTYDFGISAVSGGTVTDLHTVSYLKQTSSGLRTASPAGETVKITAFPRNA